MSMGEKTYPDQKTWKRLLFDGPPFNGSPTPLPELIADREAIHAAQKKDLKRKTVKVRKSLLP